MSDIFISYSRKDSEQALALAEKLRVTGMDVWIDRHGLELASSWSKDIVEAIEQCKAFVLLLSEHSLASNNVVKELSIASESARNIIPIEITHVHLTSEFKYPLAGLQRAPISDLEGIIRSLEKLGLVPNPTSPQLTAFSKRAPDNRKSLIVLPFEDLSPTGEDNAWFADGLAGEMIDALGHIKSLRILDRKTSLGLRGTKLRMVEIGKEFNTRYFIEGSVRKFGEQIKISVSLLDIETGEHLWQESHKGKFEDIFAIQESVAQKVVDGLKLHLTKEEKTLLQERGTENAEAYELFIKASEYAHRNTREGFLLAIQLSTEAIRLDPGYANAYQFKAYALGGIFRSYDRDPVLLEEGLRLVAEAFRLKPDLWKAYHPLSMLYQLQGKFEAAEEAVKTWVQKQPEDSHSHSALGFIYMETGQYDKAIAAFEQAVKLNPDAVNTIFNLAVCCNGANEQEKRKYWAEIAIPLFERHLKMVPEDESARVCHTLLFHFANRDDEARIAARKLENLKDGSSLYNTACLQCELQDFEAGIRTFRKAIEAGFRNAKLVKEFIDDERIDFDKLQAIPEYQEVRVMVQKLLQS
jgi:adenylate cyclase